MIHVKSDGWTTVKLSSRRTTKRSTTNNVTSFARSCTLASQRLSFFFFARLTHCVVPCGACCASLLRIAKQTKTGFFSQRNERRDALGETDEKQHLTCFHTGEARKESNLVCIWYRNKTRKKKRAAQMIQGRSVH